MHTDEGVSGSKPADDRPAGHAALEALAARRAAGVRLGRPIVLGTEIVARIVAERQGGATLWGIANGLTADGVHTAKERHELTKGASPEEAATTLATSRGTAEWKAASVRKILLGQDAANLTIISA